MPEKRLEQLNYFNTTKKHYQTSMLKVRRTDENIHSKNSPLALYKYCIDLSLITNPKPKTTQFINFIQIFHSVAYYITK